MKLNFYKCAGGNLQPADDICAEKMLKFKTGEIYPVEIKRARNPAYHGKMFSFFRFAFDHWKGNCEFQSEEAQFESFRNELTVRAGYYHQVFSFDGQSFQLVPKSLSFASMDQQEFEQCAIAMQNAAMQTLFKGADEKTIERLYSFF